MRLRCTVATLTGDLHGAVRFGERGVGATAATGSPLAGNGRLPLAEALLEIGEPERCREQLAGPEGEVRLPPFPFYEASSMSCSVAPG